MHKLIIFAFRNITGAFDSYEELVQLGKQEGISMSLARITIRHEKDKARIMSGLSAVPYVAIENFDARIELGHSVLLLLVDNMPLEIVKQLVEKSGASFLQTPITAEQEAILAGFIAQADEDTDPREDDVAVASTATREILDAKGIWSVQGSGDFNEQDEIDAIDLSGDEDFEGW